MNIQQQLAAKIRALTVFCIEKRGRCFNGIEAAKLFRYVAFHVLNGTLFTSRDGAGNVQMVAFIWRDKARDIARRASANEPQFAWQMPASEGDALFVAEVIGNRRWMPQILSSVKALWPDSPRLRLFTYRRRGDAVKLRELTWLTAERFAHELT